MESSSDHTLALSLLVQMSRRIRSASSIEETAFIIVNETKHVLQYRQSALWLSDRGVCAVSGLPVVDHNTPYVIWLSEVFKHFQEVSAIKQITAADIPETLASAWGDWLPDHALACPLKDREGRVLGLLLLAREQAWQEAELAVMEELGSIYAYGLRFFFRPHLWRRRLGLLLGTAPRRIAAGLAVLALLFLPVRLSVLAPAEVSPKDAFLVRAPLDGVIERFSVMPNEPVQEGRLLFELDKTNLKARMGVARKAFEVASEEYRQSSMLSLSDDKGKTELAPRRGRMEEKAEELSYSKEMYRRVEVRAPRSGVAVFSDYNDWIGKTVAIGERVMLIADPARVEMLIHLPAADAIALEPGAKVTLYLSAQPQRPYSGVLRYASYRADPTPSGVVAYTLKADFSGAGSLPRIGLSGTARIYGDKVSLGYYLLRRPFAALRQRLGW